MNDDPRRVLVEVVARLGRETQFHLDERHRHFWITDMVIVVISLMLLVIAVFNVYYVRILYQELNGIVVNMDSMHDHLREVKNDMLDITGKVKQFDVHMRSMDEMEQHTQSMTKALPRIGTAMQQMAGQVQSINAEMVQLRNGMGNIDQRTARMLSGVGSMRQNVRQIARPMGMMNPFMP